MNLTAIFIADGMGLILLGVMYVVTMLKKMLLKPYERLLQLVIPLTAGSCIMEALCFWVDGKQFPGAYALNMVSNIYQYTATVLYAFLWCVIVDLQLYERFSKLRKLYSLILIIPVAGVVFSVLNCITPLYFSIDADNVYHREKYIVLHYAFLVIELLYSVFRYYFYNAKTGRRRKLPIWLFLIPTFIGILVQVIHYGVATDWVGVIVGFAGYYMAMQSEIINDDKLTRLYNRNYYEDRMVEIEKGIRPFGALLLDIDHFKDINDKYSHDVGNVALQKFAEMMQQASPSESELIRTGGNTFVILYETSDEDQLMAIERKLHTLIVSFNIVNEGSTTPYKLSYSFSYGLFTPGSSTVDTFRKRLENNLIKNRTEKEKQQSFSL
ncbi:MAG: GGDEF domain-containing protein [Lachnospiraceae bacterium]|nr:GGDEF domain-containing protein [Lachnospiraceae bacterium]